MMEKTDETIPSREELAVFIEEAAVSVTNNYEEAPAVLMVDDAGEFQRFHRESQKQEDF